ncbi:uncharacterized protein MCAP_0864-like [Aedes albopictus]|uniref:Uncharacterized protein n=1 Tax=Aedes albopictus TaxID=7160 RepID=A0ABM1YFE3_AEDAL
MHHHCVFQNTCSKSNKMNEQEFQFARTDFDLDTVRNKLINCICELQSRRNEVTSLKSALDETNRSKATLEQDAKNFRRELSDMQDQLKIALNALNQKDSIRNGFMENAARQNVQLEALTNDNERLNGKIQASQVKILELTRDNNKLLEQLKVLQGTQNQPGEGTDRIWKAMDTLNSHLQKLEAEHVILTETAQMANKIAEEAAVAVVNSRRNLVNVQKENLLLRRRITDLEARIVSFSCRTEPSESVATEEDSCKKFEEHLKAVNEELEQEREVNSKLRSDIATLLTLQSCFSKPLLHNDDDGHGIGEVHSSMSEVARPDEPDNNDPMNETS